MGGAMGCSGSLPQAVEAGVIECHGTKKFQVAVAEMNGWRPSMEDAHLVFIQDEYAIFGVFDGHGGSQCSEFVASRMHEQLTELHDEIQECPDDDETMKDLFFEVDKQYLATLPDFKESGCSATMCIVRKPSKPGEKHKLHVINAGDSRILLGKRDGSIVDGKGTDRALTTDHKPEHPTEKARIERCGGTVEVAEGTSNGKHGNVSKLNGKLTVSRGFGSQECKETGGPEPGDRPVTVEPEMGHFECGEADFLMLMSKGITAGDFPHSAATKLVADMLKDGQDIGFISLAVCHKAMETGSEDNLTCTIVLLKGTAEPHEKRVTFFPGPIDKLGHKGFREAYAAMCRKGNVTLGEAAAKRYEMLQVELKHNTKPGSRLKDESLKIGTPQGAPRSEERTQWFEKWVSELPEELDKPEPTMEQMMEQMGGKGEGKGGGGAGKGGYSGNQKAPKPEFIEQEADGYTWSQKGDEVQVLVKCETAATKKDVKVAFKAKSLSVSVRGEVLLEGGLAGQVETDDCTWCLAGGGKELQVMLTKKNAQETWPKLLSSD